MKKLFSSAIKFIKTHKKLSLLIFIVSLVILYLVFPKGAKPLLSEKAVKKDVTKSVSVTGEISAENTVNLSFQSPETLAYVGVKEGDFVSTGQVIAYLDQSKLLASQRQAEQDFNAAKAASEKYYDNHNDTESLDEKVQRTAIDAAQNKAYDQLLKIRYDIAHSVLYSPIDGIVTRADAKDAGINISPSTIFTVTDPTSLYFRMEVDEADIGQVQEGQNVSVSLDPFPDRVLSLVIEKIDFVSHKSTSGGNAFYVKALLNDLSNYRVGMSGNADIIIDKRAEVVSVPTSSIFEETYVYVPTKGKYEKRKVAVGLQSDIDSEITSGLSEGEEVVLDPGSIPLDKVIKK